MSTSRPLVVGVVALGLVLALAGCAARGDSPAGTQAASFFGGSGGGPKPAARPVPREHGARLYAALCASCHGADGRATTPLAADLEVTPADLTRCNFKYRSTPAGSLPRDLDLERTIFVGIPGTAMPSFGALLHAGLLPALAEQVKERCARFGAEEPDPAVPLTPPSLYTPESIAHGRAVYERERCASCHGEGGRGDGPAARTLKDARGRPVRPRDHTAGVYRSGFRRLDLYRAFSTGLDGTPMPALPPAVTAEDRSDLANYLVSLSERRSRVVRDLVEAPSWYDPVRARGLPWR